MLAIAGIAFVLGAVVGSGRAAPPGYSLAEGFVGAWTRGDYLAMYADIDAAARHRISAGEFAAAYRNDLTTATATGMLAGGHARGAPGGRVTVPVEIQTRIFGRLSLSFAFRFSDSGGEGTRIAWSPSMAFPGLREGEQLSRNMTLPRRASLLARDGSVLAESTSGEAQSPEAGRSYPLGAYASAVVGSVGAIPAAHREELEAQGVPPTAAVGVSGLELGLDSALRGTPGGQLLAVDAGAHSQRVLASAAPRAAPAIRSTISPAVQRAAVSALGGQLGGIVALEPASGQILAVAGLGLDGLQPPGSTFKMVTVTGVLGAGLATPSTVFPYATHAVLDGVKLENANGEECGGTLELAFAVSCNSVFTPLGVKLGAPRLVATAEGFGFNHPTGVPGASESTLPPAAQIQGELDVGSTAIGQGEVLATPLQMATVAATIADGGRRPRPTFLLDAPGGTSTRVMSAAVARTVRHLMIGVVSFGTGTAAAIPGVTVAGKTGTAELKSGCTSTEAASGEAAHKEAGAEGCQEASNTDAWFAAFAPALKPRIVVCVMLVKDGAGGATAAPLAREVLEAALQAGR